MPSIIALIIFLISLIGIIFFLFKKVPMLSVYNVYNSPKSRIFENLKYRLRAKMSQTSDNISSSNLLLKVLSKSRILFLKAEHGTGLWLAHLRRKSIENNAVKKDFGNGYWDGIRSSKKKARKPKLKKV